MHFWLRLGYTLVYGILLMINFAHGEVMMTACNFWKRPQFSVIHTLFVRRSARRPKLPVWLAMLFMMIIVVAVAMIGLLIARFDEEQPPTDRCGAKSAPSGWGTGSAHR
jgi:branched-subunit amino acid ABC-type transport system permease component